MPHAVLFAEYKGIAPVRCSLSAKVTAHGAYTTWSRLWSHILKI